MTAEPAKGLTPRERHRADLRARILVALMDLVNEGEEVNHDRLADRAGVARRTVYRYFPDQQALMTALWTSVAAMAAQAATVPADETALTNTSPYPALDTIAPIATLIHATPQGRHIRAENADARREAYAVAVDNAAKALEASDRRMATALIQALHSELWLSVRDSWDLSGKEAAIATNWAIRVLLRDLRAREGRPLAEGPAEECA